MRLLIHLILVALFLVFHSSFVQAHTLKSNNGFSLILHVEPNDDPVAGRKSNLRLLFTQTPADFDPAEGECLVEIYQSGKLLYRQDVFRDNQSIDDIHFNFVFPEIGLYQIKVLGKPDKIGGFQAFKFEYDLRVEKKVNLSLLTKNSPGYIGLIFFSGLLIYSATIIFHYVKRNSD